jgi:antirestriction protein
MRKTYESLSNTASLQDFKTIFLMNYVNGEDFIANTIEDLRKDAILLS